MTTHSSILAREAYEQRRPAGYGPWGSKEPDMTEAADHTDMRSVTCIPGLSLWRIGMETYKHEWQP